MTAYLFFILLTALFIYFTPLWDDIIDFVEKHPIIISILAIFGDSLYMIGGGIVASAAFTNGFTILTLINNNGTILIVLGAIMREYFKKVADK